MSLLSVLSAVGEAIGSGASSALSSLSSVINGSDSGGDGCSDGSGDVSVGSGVSGSGSSSGTAPSVGSGVGSSGMSGGGGAGGGAYIDDSAYINAACEQAKAIRKDARIDAMLSIGYGLFNLFASLSITNMQNEIADRQLKMAEEMHEHAKKFWDAEFAFLDEAFSLKKECPKYTATSLAWGGMFEQDMQEGFNDYVRYMEQNCMTTTRCQQAYWDAQAGLMNADIRNFSLRTAETRAEALNDLRYAMQYAALGLGRGVLKDALSYSDVAGAMKLDIAGFYSDILTFGFSFPHDYSKVPEYKIRRQPYAPMPEPPTVVPPTTSTLGGPPPTSTLGGPPPKANSSTFGGRA